MKIAISCDEYSQHREDSDGVCLACGAWTLGGVEPDARGYACEACGEPRVVGAEEAILMGAVDVEDEL